MRKRKSWREKLADDKGLPRVEPIGPRQRARWGKGTVALPSPAEVNAIMRRVPFGKVITTSQIREAVARKHHATIGCPLVTGIFAWIAANAAEEAAQAGEKNTTAYWRTLKANGELNPKFPGGTRDLSRHLRNEGHKITKRGLKYFVADFQKSICSDL